MRTEPLAREELLGSSLLDRYHVRAFIGRGGMGEVFEAVDLRLDRTVAIKVLRPELAADRRLVARFRREASTAARLAHPGIVAVHDVGDDGPVTFIVMEFVAGRTLTELTADAPVPATRVRSIALEAARALAHAHARGVVHRDVAPGNVMVTAEGRVKILDFGIARAMRGSGRPGSSSAHGTVAYVAPEVIDGVTADQRADVYALGAVCYQLLTGHPPFEGSSDREVARRLRTERPVRPRAWNAAVPEDLEAVVLRCLAREPGERFPDAEAVATALERLSLDAAATHPLPLADRGPGVARTEPLTHPATRPLPVALEEDRIETRPRRGSTVVRRSIQAVIGLMGVAVLILVVPAVVATSTPVRPTVRGPAPVPAPSALGATGTCDGFLAAGVDLSWVPGEGAKGTEIWRRTSSDAPWRRVARVAAPVSTYRDADLALDRRYEYLVRGFAGMRTSRASVTAAADTPLLCLT
jgi:predicted Ser/Thr protein kinase